MSAEDREGWPAWMKVKLPPHNDEGLTAGYWLCGDAGGVSLISPKPNPTREDLIAGYTNYDTVEQQYGPNGERLRNADGTNKVRVYRVSREEAERKVDAWLSRVHR